MAESYFYYDPMTLPEARELIANYTKRGIKTEMIQNGESGLVTVRALLQKDSREHKPGYATRTFR